MVSDTESRLEEARADFEDAKNKLLNFNLSNDPALNSLLQGIAGGWDARMNDMRRVNASREAAVQALGFRIGAARYAAGVAGGILTAEEREGLNRLADLEGRKQAALAEARQAYEKNRWDQYVKFVDIAEKEYDRQLKSVEELNKKNQEENAKLEAQNRLSNIDLAVGKLLTSGTSNKVDIQQELVEAGFNPSSKEIDEAISNYAPFEINEISDMAKFVKSVGGDESVIQSMMRSGSLENALKIGAPYMQNKLTASSYANAVQNGYIKLENVPSDMRDEVVGLVDFSKLPQDNKYSSVFRETENGIEQFVLDEYQNIVGRKTLGMSGINARKVREAIANFNSADSMLSAIEDLTYKVVTAENPEDIPAQYISGRIESISRYNPDAVVFLSSLDAFSSMLTRAAGEKGVLTTQDVQRIINALPKLTDTKASAKLKIDTLKSLYEAIKSGSVSAYTQPISGSEELQEEVDLSDLNFSM